jgi:hypothetical protein
MIDFERTFTPQKSISLLLVLLLLPLQAVAQSANPPATANQAAGRGPGLKIYVLQGSGAVNFIPDQHATTPVIEVRDANELPVSGATVEFHLPEGGAGGVFLNGQHNLTAVTNVSGQAEAPFNVAPTPGQFEIQVTAKLDTRTAAVIIYQLNTLKLHETTATATSKKKHWYTNWKYMVPIGAGAAIVAILLATRDTGSSNSGPSVGLTPGVPSYGVPH